MRLTALPPAPLSATAAEPPAEAATEPAKTVELMVCCESAETFKSRVLSNTSAILPTEDSVTKASMRLAAGLVNCSHFSVSEKSWLRIRSIGLPSSSSSPSRSSSPMYL